MPPKKKKHQKNCPEEISEEERLEDLGIYSEDEEDEEDEGDYDEDDESWRNFS